jgi:DNA polymerase III subunit epsilon
MADAGGDGEAWRPAPKRRLRPLWLALVAAGLCGGSAGALVVVAGLRTPAGAAIGLADLTKTELVAAFVVALLVALGAVAAVLAAKVLAPLRRLAAETRFVAEARDAKGVTVEPGSWLAPLPAAIAAVATALGDERRHRADEIAQSTRSLAEQKARLETILRDLAEGVLICNLDHRVLLYNHAALGLLHVAGELGLGRSLFNLVACEPILHALERLLHADERDGSREDVCSLVCATADSTRLLLGRLSLTRTEAGHATGYVLTLTDATREVAALAARDRLLRELAEGLRRPLANLHAAAETLDSFPDMQPTQRRGFDSVVQRESVALASALARFDDATRELKGSAWPLADVLSIDVFRILARRSAEEGGPSVTPVGLPRWLHVDSQSLVVALARIAHRIGDAAGVGALDVAAAPGTHAAYVDFVWAGAPIASPAIDRWLEEALPGALGATTLGDVLQRHGSTLWSLKLDDGRAQLRMPVPVAAGNRGGGDPPRALPARPEFYDFDLLNQPREVAHGALQRLTFVVFDTETTGLKPSEGDEIVSIGAVRVVNGRILTGETFTRLVNPGRTIPPGSIRFHGITDAMVADAPPATVALPQLRAFCEGAVLVAHNAAFDLKFLKLKEAESGAIFDMPVLDTLLISAFLYPEIQDHDLDAIAARVGVEIVGRHTALGDAMATAAVFVRLLELLEKRGVTTLEKLMDASRMTYELRARARQF